MGNGVSMNVNVRNGSKADISSRCGPMQRLGKPLHSEIIPSGERCMLENVAVQRARVRCLRRSSVREPVHCENSSLAPLWVIRMSAMGGKRTFGLDNK